MRARWLFLAAAALPVGACAQVLGLDEPTVTDGSGGAAASSSAETSATVSTSGASSTTSLSSSNVGPGGGEPVGSGGGGADVPCRQNIDCDDANPCTIDVCSDGDCVNEATGTVPEDATDDCVDIRCDGAEPTAVADDTEDAADPAPPCHTATCSNGLPMSAYAPVDTPCGEAPLACDGEGACTGCEGDVDCGVVQGCAIPECSADGVCDPGLLVAGTVVPDPEGNCRVRQCSGQSGVANEVLASDDPPPDVTCGVGTCLAGSTPYVQPAPQGTACAVGLFVGRCSGGTTGDAACVECSTQGDCDFAPEGGRCFADADACGCSGAGDCEEPWRLGPSCMLVAGEPRCGCSAPGDCTASIHGAVCVDQACGCTNSDQCLDAGSGPECDLSTNRCRCILDAQCAGSLLGEICIGDDHCGCVGEADCPAGSNCDQTLGYCID